MILDKLLQLAALQAVTVTALSTNVLDLGAAVRDIGVGEPLELLVTCDEAAAAAGAATVQFQLVSDDNEAVATPTVVVQSDTIGKAALTAGTVVARLPVPAGFTERYLALRYVVGTGPLTAGKFSAHLAPAGIQANRAYPNSPNAI